MVRHLLLVSSLSLLGLNAGPPETIDLGDALQQGADWLKENLDDRVAAQLPELDRPKLEGYLKQFQAEMGGEYVIDLAQAKTTAHTVLPVLEATPAFRPYAAWLKTRLDYFDVADELRLSAPTLQPSAPGRPPTRPPNPTPQAQRMAWTRQLKTRPAAPGTPAMAEELRPIFTAAHVPGELVWLAEVESSFNPQARSPAGAVGLYQLMPVTAKSEGLQLTPSDERLDPTKNARAAATLLHSLHRQFPDWRLTLAAYNAGQGRVRELLGNDKSRGYDQIARHLPAETQLYVPKVEATVKGRTGMSLAELKTPP